MWKKERQKTPAAIALEKEIAEAELLRKKGLLAVSQKPLPDPKDEPLFDLNEPSAPRARGPSEDEHKRRVAQSISVFEKRREKIHAPEERPMQGLLEGGKTAVRTRRKTVFISTRSAPNERTLSQNESTGNDNRFAALVAGALGHEVAEAVFIAMSKHPLEIYSAMPTTPKKKLKVVEKLARGVALATDEKWPVPRFASWMRETLDDGPQATLPGLEAGTGNKSATKRFEDRFDNAALVGHRIKIWIEKGYLPRLTRPIIEAAIRQVNTTKEAYVYYRSQADIFGYEGNALYFVSLKTGRRPAMEEVRRQEIELLENIRLAMGTNLGRKDTRYVGHGDFNDRVIHFNGFSQTLHSKPEKVIALQVYAGEENPRAAIVKKEYAVAEVIKNKAAREVYERNRDSAIAAKTAQSIGKKESPPPRAKILTEKDDPQSELTVIQRMLDLGAVVAGLKRR